MNPALTSPESARRRLLACAAIAFLTAGYLIFHEHTHTAEALLSASEDFLAGRTHWMTFQNRVFAPLLIAAIRTVTGLAWLPAFYILIGGCMAAGAGLLLWRSWRDTGKSTRGLVQSGAWFLVAVLLNHEWSYPWDYTGALLFLLLAVWARDRFHTLAAVKSGWLAALLVALALNRESSLFVLAALGCAALVSGYQERAWPRAGRAAIAFAVAGCANLTGILLLRQALFVAPTRPTYIEGPELASGNFNQVPHNWHVLTHLSAGWPALPLVLVLLVLNACMLREIVRILRRGESLSPGRLFAQLCGAFGTGAILLFADTTESRVFFEFAPVWLLLATEAAPWPGTSARP